MSYRIRLAKIALKVFVPAFGSFLAYWLSRLIVFWLPDLKFPVSTVDLFGFAPSFLAVVAALSFFLRGSRNDRYLKIIKICVFVVTVALAALFLADNIYIRTGFNFDLPMILSLVLFTAWNAIGSLIDFEKKSSIFTLISDENSLREALMAVFSFVGFPLLLLDAYIAFWFFGMGVLGGAGLKDGLNVMLLTLVFYALLLYGANSLANKLGK